MVIFKGKNTQMLLKKKKKKEKKKRTKPTNKLTKETLMFLFIC